MYFISTNMQNKAVLPFRVITLALKIAINMFRTTEGTFFSLNDMK